MTTNFRVVSLRGAQYVVKLKIKSAQILPHRLKIAYLAALLGQLRSGFKVIDTFFNIAVGFIANTVCDL